MLKGVVEEAESRPVSPRSGEDTTALAASERRRRILVLEKIVLEF